MKELFFILAVLIIFSAEAYAQDSRVNGYYRNDGRYVDSYQRQRSANSNVYERYSGFGNVESSAGSGRGNAYHSGRGKVERYNHNSGGSGSALPPGQAQTPPRGSTYNPGSSPYNTGGGRLGGPGGDPLRGNNQHFKW